MQRDDSLGQGRRLFLKDLLAAERRRLEAGNAARQNELRQSISQREAELRDDDGIYRQFEQHIAALPYAQRPANARQKAVLYAAWEGEQRAELAGWREALAAGQAQTIPGHQVFNAAKGQLLELLEAEARAMGLLRAEESVNPVSRHSGEWLTFIQLYEWGRVDPRGKATLKPELLKDPAGKDIPVKNWADFLFQTADWLVQEELLTEADCPVSVGSMRSRYLIHYEPVHSTRVEFWSPRQLSNGLSLETSFSGGQISSFVKPLVEKFGQDPAQFRVLLR